jgi:hypothetical protein
MRFGKDRGSPIPYSCYRIAIVFSSIVRKREFRSLAGNIWKNSERSCCRVMITNLVVLHPIAGSAVGGQNPVKATDTLGAPLDRWNNAAS